MVVGEVAIEAVEGAVIGEADEEAGVSTVEGVEEDMIVEEEVEEDSTAEDEVEEDSIEGGVSIVEEGEVAVVEALASREGEFYSCAYDRNAFITTKIGEASDPD